MSLGKTLSDFISVSREPLFHRYSPVNEEASSVPRLLFLQVLTLALFLALLAALFRLQVIQGPYYRALAEGNRIRELPIHAPRGIIFERNGAPLVSNLPAFRLRQCRGSECTASVISKDQAVELEARRGSPAGLPEGAELEIDSSRRYPEKEAFAHLLGYVSEITSEELASDKSYNLGDKIGRGGVEEAYQEKLQGRTGKELVEVDAQGKKLRTLSTINPTPGENLTLSIESMLQRTAFNQIKDKKGAVVAENPETGEIYALVSSPSFDPNLFTDPNLPFDYRGLKVSDLLSDKQQPLFNRAIAGLYPSGSTFKIVTAVAGLESGKINESTTIDDPGILVIGPYKFPNWKFLADGGTQGVLNVVGALKVSNDVFFYKVSEWAGIDALADWAKKFGLGKILGIDIPGESPGSIPTEDWRRLNKPDWYLGDTYHLAIGQGDLLVTPLQVNNWTSVIANGGRLCQPRLAKNGQWAMGNGQSMKSGQCKDVGISQKTIELVKEGMGQACSPGGTAWPLFNFEIRNPKSEIRKIQIACKTGTAEYGDPAGRTHAWLTAFVDKNEAAKINAAPIAVTVLVEGGGEGSDVAAPIVKKILETWFTK